VETLESTLIEQHREKTDKLSFYLKKNKNWKVCKAEEVHQKADERIGKTYKSFESFQKTKIFHQVLKSRNWKKKSMVQSSSKEYALKRPYVILCDLMWGSVSIKTLTHSATEPLYWTSPRWFSTFL
jgi:hypothetical protein